MKEILAETADVIEVSDSVTTHGKSADEVLTALIESDFDLNTLNEWDKIKSN